MFKRFSLFVSCQLCFVVVFGGFAFGETSWTATDAVRRLQEAVDVLKRDCGVDILNRSFPIEFSCGGRFVTAGDAWSDSLDKAGFPRDIGERERIARKIGLDRTDEFNFATGRANNIAVSRLLFNLKLLSEK